MTQSSRRGDGLIRTRRVRPRLGRLRLALVPLVVLTLAVGCTKQIEGSGSQSQVRPGGDTNFQIIGDAGTAYDELAKKAMVDIYAFWDQEFPQLAGGAPFADLAGGVWSVDGANPSKASLKEGCLAKSPSVVQDNLMHCRVDDSVAYDRTSKFFTDLVAQTGDFTLAAVFAHEIGHAIQYRLKITMPTVYAETQADCFAGSWIGWILAGNGTNFRTSGDELDLALTGYIQLRDPAGSDASDQSAHGNGFDRIAAVADGIQNGASYCVSNWQKRGITERPYTSQADYNAGGDLPYNGDPAGNDTVTLGPADLESFWKDAFAGSNRTWKPVTAQQTSKPSCSTEKIKDIGYCSATNTVQYKDDELRGAHGYGDFAAMTMLGIGWGLSVRHQLGQETSDGAALLAAACYQGAYAATRNVAVAPVGGTGLTLSPSDMDEGTIALLTLVGADTAYGDRGTQGYQRIQYFITGYFGGLPSC
jgi:predicted metalloprotease